MDCSSLPPAKIRLQQAVAHEVARRPCPGFVGIAAEIGVDHVDELSGMRVAHEDGEVEYQGRNLPHHACDNEISPDPLRIVDVAAAAGLKVACLSRRLHRRNVEYLELAGLRQLPTHLVADKYQPIMLVGLRPPHFAFEARIHQLEIEDG